MSDSPAHVTLEDVDGDHKTVRYDSVMVLDSGALHCRNGTYGGGGVTDVVYYSPLAWHTVERVDEEDSETQQSRQRLATTGDELIADSDALDMPGGVCKGP